MKKVLCIAAVSLSLTACGLLDMPDKMDKTNKNMDTMIENTNHTNKQIDKQAKLIPFESMLKAENSENLSPIPTRLMPFGKELALALSADDMLELTYLWLKEVDEVFPAHKLDDKGDEIPYTADEVAKINHDKTARVIGLQIIAGFLPQEVITEMIQNQVYTGGRYEDTVYAILMLRTQFIRDVLLDASLLSGPLNNPGKVATAIEYNKNIDFIAKLPFAAKIILKTKGFIPTEDSPVETLDPAIALKNWQRIQRSAEADCVVKEEAVTGNPAQDQRIAADKRASLAASESLLQSYISSWGALP
jgi:hypothetical protein